MSTERWTLGGANVERGDRANPRLRPGVVLRVFTPKGQAREVELTKQQALSLARQLIGAVQAVGEDL